MAAWEQPLLRLQGTFYLDEQTKNSFFLIGPNIYVATGIRRRLTKNLSKFRIDSERIDIARQVDINIYFKKKLDISGKLLCIYRDNWKIIKPEFSNGYDHLIEVVHDSKNFKILFSKESKIDIFPNKEKQFNPSYLLANAMFFHWSLYPQYGYLFHASSVVNNKGKALLFIGEAGAGKSTMAELWKERGFQVLNDDRILVTEGSNGSYIAHGIPWGGTADIAEPISAPISDIYILSKNREGNQLRPVSPARAISELMNRSFHAFWSRKQVEDMFARYYKLVNKIRYHELSFVPDEKAIEFILEK